MPAQLDAAEQPAQALSDFRHVTVELSGREGYNAAAVNGVWRFWKVLGGRLAFRRDAELEASGDGSPRSPEADVGGPVAVGGATFRLFLFYLPEVDAWLISDSADTLGSVAADCGPVGHGGADLGQHWRVWDGSDWREDRNIVAEVAHGGPRVAALDGLRVAAPRHADHGQRAQSQDPRRPREPEAHERRARAPESARLPRPARPHDITL